MYGSPTAKKVFNIPVEWSVSDTVEIAADTLEDAIKFLIENEDSIPIGTEPEYIGDSYKISGIDDYEQDIKGLSEYLREYYNCKGRKRESFDCIESI